MGIWTWVHLDLGTFVLGPFGLGGIWNQGHLELGTFGLGGNIWNLSVCICGKGPSEMGGFHMLAHAHGGVLTWLYLNMGEF